MPPFLLDLAYLVLLLAAAPFLIYKAARSGKYRTGLGQKLFGLVPARSSRRPCVWFHAVSVGEVLLLEPIVARLRARRADAEIVLSTTTNSGMEVARGKFKGLTLFYFPLDFSWSVRTAVARVRPDLVVLAELELWPNFIRAARRSGARVAVVNGRMSPHSFAGYHRLGLVMRRVFRWIDVLAVQTDAYAERFVRIGAPRDRVVVTGSVKYDGIETERANPRTRALAALFALEPDQVVWVAGSTSEPEEEIVLDAYRRLLPSHPRLRLVLVPRHKERFAAVARLITERHFALVRRSELPRRPAPGAARAELDLPVILVDTLGELSAVWGLADIAFVGGSFAPRGGQNMIEPAGYGAAVLFGPGVWNFQDTVDQLRARGGAVQLATPPELLGRMQELLSDREQRTRLGAAARGFVREQHGAAAKTVELLEQRMPARPEHSLASHAA